MTIVCEAPEHAGAPHPRLPLQARDHRRRRRGRPRRRRRPRALPDQGRRRPNAPNGPHSRSQIFELAKVFRARVVDLAPESIMLEMTGSSSKIEGLIQVLTRVRLHHPRDLAHRPHGHAPRPPHQPRASKPWAASRTQMATEPTTAVSLDELTRSSPTSLKTCTRKRS